MVANGRRGAALAGLATLFLAVGCGRNQQAQLPAAAPVTKPAPATPIDIKRGEIGGPMWDPAWDQVVERALPPELLSDEVARDVRPFCPGFSSMGEMDKRRFWAYFFQALAGAEAGLNPTAHVRHSEPEMEVKDQVTGVQVRTEGLLQLAYEDEKRYGCNFNWETDRKLPAGDPARTILQPRNNLECGVKILDQEVVVQHKPLLSRAEYWSTLQPGTASYRVFLKQMTNVPAGCRVRARLVRASQPRHEERAVAATTPP